MDMIQGQKLKLNELLGNNLSCQLQITINSHMTVDTALFGLDDRQQLSNDDNMIFYNQPRSPCGSIVLNTVTAKDSVFDIDLNTLPNTISRLTLTLAIDGQGTMAQLDTCHATIKDEQGQTIANFTFDGSIFDAERAIMLIEIYRKSGVWRLGATAQGFNGGLASLIEHFGGEVDDATEAENTEIKKESSQKTTVDLRKKVILEKANRTNSDDIIDLTKKSLLQLEKRKLLTLKAKVALVLDASGSMNWQYKNGDVQRVVDRVMPLAMSFDDDGSFECWAFGELTQRLDDVNIDNVKNYIETTKLGWKNWTLGSRINKEIPAINQVIDYYNKTNDKTPTYVLFVSDGGVGNKSQMKRLLIQAANLPIFWQFIGIGGKNYGILETLDNMEGRVVDNCNFFAINSIRSLSDEQLYAQLLREFPDWLKAAKQANIIR